MTMNPNHNFLDRCLVQVQQGIRACVPGSYQAQRENPAAAAPTTASTTASTTDKLSSTDRRRSAGFMRVNHTGEVCAQALYHGQAATASLGEVRTAMEQAAAEETDHLVWCEQRLKELHSRSSLLNPLWYAMSYGLGAAAGLAGDRWSLGFVAETEQQVCEHLQDHLRRLPEADTRSRAIVSEMIKDEKHHAETAQAAGGSPLPPPLRLAMHTMAQVMKTTTYYV